MLNLAVSGGEIKKLLTGCDAMIVVNNRFIPARFSAYTFLFVILIRPESADDQALLAHEQAHVAAFWRNPIKVMFNWLVESWKFDFELEGFRAEYRVDPTRIEVLADELSTNYGFGISREHASRLICRS